MLWQDNYSTGIEKIDEHHKQLVELISRLEKALVEGQVVKEMGQVIKALVDYTKYHFREEEQLMQRWHFSELPVHKKKHKDLVDEIVQMLLKIRQGKHLDAIELLEFLKRWLVDHILKEDSKLGRAQAMAAPKDPQTDEGSSQLKQQLKRLTTLLKKELINSEDFQAKRSACLEDFVVMESDATNDTVDERLAVLQDLSAQKLILKKELTHFAAKLFEKYDLNHALNGIPAIEDKLDLLISLRDKELLSADELKEAKQRVLDTL